jgi:hypothetical protein
MDPDPGGPKTCGSVGSGFGSATLVLGLLDPNPDPLVRDADPDPDSTIIKQN